MTSRSRLAAFVALVCCAIAARAEPALPASSGNVVIVQMHISSNGVTRYLYKGKELSDVDLKRLETNAGKAHRRVEYDLELNEQAKSQAYDNRSTHIGFTGINPGPDPQTSAHAEPSPQQPRHGD